MTVRIGAIIDDPYVYNCFKKLPLYCKSPGIDIEFLFTLIHEMIGFSVAWSEYNGFTELEQALDKNEIDMIGITVPLEEKLTRNWGYIKSGFTDGPGFVVKVRYNEGEWSDFLLLEMFTWNLWLLLIGFSLLIILIKFAFCRLYLRNIKMFPSSSFNYTKFLFCFWFLLIGIILNLFGNLIAVNLSLPNDKEGQLFDSMLQLGNLIMQNKCRLATLDKYNNSINGLYPFIINPNHNKSWAKLFKVANKLHPPIFTKDREELVNLIERDGFYFVGLDWTSLSQYYTQKHCSVKMTIFHEEFIPWMFVIYHQLHHYQELFDIIMMKDAMVSYPNYLLNKYYFSYPAETCKNRSNVIADPIPFRKLKDDFVILIVGIILSFILCCTIHIKLNLPILVFLIIYYCRFN